MIIVMIWWYAYRIALAYFSKWIYENISFILNALVFLFFRKLVFIFFVFLFSGFANIIMIKLEMNWKISSSSLYNNNKKKVHCARFCFPKDLIKTFFSFHFCLIYRNKKTIEFTCLAYWYITIIINDVWSFIFICYGTWYITNRLVWI